MSAPPRAAPARVGGSIIVPDFPSFFRMVLVMASRTKRSAIAQIVSQFRKSICVFYVMCHCCLCPSAITSALLTEITSPSEDQFPPFFMTLFVVKLGQIITPQSRISERSAANPPLQCICLCISIAAPATGWRTPMAPSSPMKEQWDPAWPRIPR